MKQFVGSVAADFAEILVIKLFDLGVFVGFALCLARVLGVKRLGAQLLNIEIHEILGADNGLSAAGYAAAGAPMTSMK